MALSSPPVALVLRALGLGDFLTGVPALRALRRALPGYELVLASPEELEPLVQLAAVAARVVNCVGLDDDHLVEANLCPEIAVNLHGRGPQSSRLLQKLASHRLVAFECAEADVVGPPWRADEHEVRRWCRLVREGLGAPADPADLAIAAPRQLPAAERAVVIHPGAAFASRRWPASRFSQVAAWAMSTGSPVVVTGSPSETELAEQVAADAGLTAADVLAGQTTLLELASLVADARLVICGDTGVAHLATAFRTPSVVLFGPVAPNLWGPPDNGPHASLWHRDVPGNPWGSSADPALLRISVGEVVGAAEQLLSDYANESARAHRSV